MNDFEITETEVQVALADEDALKELFAEIAQVRKVETFFIAGVMTDNKGVVIHLENGQKIHLTINI